MPINRGFVTCSFFLACVVAVSHGQQPDADLTNLSLDSLTSMQITSVARKEQRLTEAAGAVFVITSDDIRRSGLSNIAELLRTVPGLDVAQIDANEWAITTRGFNERNSDRTLFLLDGRTLNAPLSSGVTWDLIQLPLEDIERIEVIRGPGATLWGANAMDGVVNIITKDARNTQSTVITGTVQKQSEDVTTVRYGGTAGSLGHYRVYGELLRGPATELSAGNREPDFWYHVHTGFRGDWTLRSGASLRIEADAFRGQSGETASGEVTIANPIGAPKASHMNSEGGDISVRWSKAIGHLDSTIFSYFAVQNRSEPEEITDDLATADIEIDQNYQLNRRHDLSWGANVRNNFETDNGSLSLSFSPPSRNLPLFGAYFQDEISLLPDKVKFTAGGKLEHSYYSGFVLLPNARLIWIANKHTDFWTSVARAAASPSRADTDVRYNEALESTPGGLVLVSLFGSSVLAPEVVTAYEFGARYKPQPRISFDTAAFYNHYSNFHTNEPGTPYIESGYGGLPPHLVQPVYVRNNISGISRGIEILMDSAPSHFWKLSASYTGMLISIHPSPNSKDIQSAGDSSGSTPRHQLQIHSNFNLGHKIELDSAAYYVAKLAEGNIPAYTRFDVRAGWKPSTNLELSVGGRNLLQAHHQEFGASELVQDEPISRSAYVKATWSF